MNVDLTIRRKPRQPISLVVLFLVGNYLIPSALIFYVLSMAWSTGLAPIRISSIIILSLAVGLKVTGDVLKYLRR